MNNPVHSKGSGVPPPRRDALRHTPTVRDVAVASGVSVGVASVVLRDVESTIRVGSDTRERVRRAAEDLGYTPNAAARALRTGRTHTIGVAVRQLAHPFFGAIVEGIDAACRAAGYHLLLGDVHRDEREEQAIVGLLSHGRADGLLVVGELPGDAQAITAAAGRGAPIVLVARPSISGIPAVTLDHHLAMRVALDHLAALGHQAVALPLYVEGRAMPTSRLRISVTREYAARHGWSAPRTFDAEPTDPGSLRDWLRSAVAPARPDPEHPPITAVVASDRVAVHVLKAAQAEGIPVPGRLSVVALDGTEITTYTNPELTTVAQPLHVLGATAADLLLRRLGPPTPQDTTIDADAGTRMLEPAFIVRGSTAAVSGPPTR